MPSRDATTHWTGGLQKGKGEVTLDSSNSRHVLRLVPDPRGQPGRPDEPRRAHRRGALVVPRDEPVGRAGGRAADGGLDRRQRGGHPRPGPCGGGFEISGIAITLRAALPGVSAEKFAEYAETAEKTCPVSKALAGTTITLDAALV